MWMVDSGFFNKKQDESNPRQKQILFYFIHKKQMFVLIAYTIFVLYKETLLTVVATIMRR